MSRRPLALLGAVGLVGLIFTAALGALLQPNALAQADLTVVESNNDGRDVEMIIIAPESLRGGVDPDSFVVTIGNELVTPEVERVHGTDLDVVLLVDTSGSMTEEAFAAAKTSARQFIDAMPRGARVSVIGFGDTATVVAPFSDDHAAAAASLDQLFVGGNTAMYAAVVEGARQFDPTRDSLRTIVLLSDGGNTVDESSLGAALAALQSTDASLYAVSIETEETDHQALATLANGSDGSVASVGNVDEISAQYDALALDLNNQYRLRFESPVGGRVVAEIAAWRGGSAVADTQLALTLPTVRTEGTQTEVPEVVTVEPEPTRLVTASAPNRLSFDVGDNPLLKWGAIAALAGALGLAAALVLWPGGPERQGARSQFDTGSQEPEGSAVSRFGQALGGVFERVIGGDRSAALANTLDTAGWKIRNGEFLALIGLVTVVAFFGGGLLSPSFGLTMALIWLFGVVAVLYILVRRRRDAFNEQLNSTFMTMAGALRAGYSLPQVFSFVAQEAESPTADEFSRVVVETRLGRDLVDASTDVATRMQSEDFEWAVGAIEISRDLGGDLAEVLDNVAGTIRAREQVRRQVKALSAEGRISAYILSALPFPLFFWQLIVNRDYTMLLFNTSMGRWIFFTAVAALIAGVIWMRRLIDVKF